VGNLRSGEPHEKGERRVDREPDDYGELPARGHDVVLRRPQPADKSLGDPLAGSSPAEELGKSRRRQPVRRDRREQCEHGLALAQVGVFRVIDEADVPATGGAVVLLRLLVSEEESQLERLGQADEPELGGCG
jgi:hypothetical protein